MTEKRKLKISKAQADWIAPQVCLVAGRGPVTARLYPSGEVVIEIHVDDVDAVVEELLAQIQSSLPPHP